MHRELTRSVRLASSLALFVAVAAACDVGVPSLDDLFDGGTLGDAERDPSAIEGIRCGALETEFSGPVCAARERGCASFRFVTGPATRGTVHCVAPDTGGLSVRVDEEQAGAVHHVVLQGLAAASAIECSYGVMEGEDAGSVLWTAVLEPVTDVRGPIVTEVLIDPAGTEPSQEFVEIYNPGPEPVDLTGYRLMDVDPSGLPDPLEEGDELPSGQILGAGKLALLVAQSFSTSSPDPAPAPDALLIRLDGSLARSGLRNSGGEPVYLVGPGGETVSFYPNLLGTTAAGSSVQRIDPSAPAADQDNWIEDVPTPGMLL